MAYIKTHVYTRISKTSQQEGSGIDEQLSRIESYIKSKPEQFHDEPQHWQDIGLSAFKNKNIIDGQLAEFIQQVEKGSIGEGHALVIYSLDRLSRRSSWDEDTIQKLVKAGVDIHDVSTPVVLKHDDPFSKIIMELIVQRGNNESKIKSERSTSGWAKRLKDTIENGKVFTKQLPRWLAADENNNYIVIPEQAEIIKRIFREYTNGMSSTMIARRLNDEGLKSFSGSKWWHNTITNLIKDERLRGYFIRTVDSTKIPDIYPAIIDGELFTIANRILQVNSVGIKGRPRENNKTREIKNIITGFVLCGKCGSKVTTSKNPRGVSYVKCRGRRNDEIFCGQKSIKLIELERLVINYTKQLDMSKIFSYKEADTSLEASLQSELQSLEADEKACHENIEQRKKKKKTFLPLANALIDIQDRIEEIQNKLLELNVSDPLVNIKQFNLDDLMDASKIELRMSLRKYLTQVVDRITFRSIDKNILIEIIYNKDVYRHVLIADSKISEVLNEINIVKEDGLIKYNTNNFSIIENEGLETCTFKGLGDVSVTDYFLLANYMDAVEGKRWIIDLMHDSENVETVLNN
ncbi:recombinase family protein [Aeromonas salmonicida]|uniref:recombinase family protein n=1 Tax=Aeromonas salmonicida TaxID=645 RepID=UPI002796AEBC|nr:recombinase family protein [Aeromonas salmonicida]MDQ1884893.1 recombinase family protein [Aeromonas salmonicida]